MRKKDVKDFLKKVTDLDIEVVYLPAKKVDPYAAFMEQEVVKLPLGTCLTKYRLVISRTLMYCKDDIWERALLLHEVGHAETRQQNSTPEEEYKAQSWALRKAKKLGWKNLREELFRVIHNWSSDRWNTENGAFRRYILAEKLFVKRNAEYRRKLKYYKLRMKKELGG